MAWACAIERRHGPSALCLSRQNLPRLSSADMSDHIRQGGYVLSDMESPLAVLLSTGSELELAMQAQSLLAAQGIPTRVVSMPCSNVFDRQQASYREQVLPWALPAVAIEAAQPDFWHKYVGRSGVVIGISSFGESAPATDLYAHFDITAARVVRAVQTLVQKNEARV